MLELDFLNKLEWRIIPPAEILDDYYRSLVARMDGFELETEDRLEKEAMDLKQDTNAREDGQEKDAKSTMMADGAIQP